MWRKSQAAIRCPELQQSHGPADRCPQDRHAAGQRPAHRGRTIQKYHGRSPNGRPVRLSEIATVLDSVEDDQDAAWFFTRTTKAQSIFLAVYKQPGMNTMEVANAVKKILPSLEDSLPASAKLTILRDGSLPIKDSVDDIQFTMLLTLVLVVMVIFPLHPQYLRHGHSQHVPADVDRRHLCHYVPARLQPR